MKTATETERRFLIQTEQLPPLPTGHPLTQHYINTATACIRIRQHADTYTLSFKESTHQLTKKEYELPLTPEQATQLIQHFAHPTPIHKTRSTLHHAGKAWHINQFHTPHQGLSIAEIELKSPTETFPHPPWLGTEITHDKAYSNHALSQNPTPPKPS